VCLAEGKECSLEGNPGIGDLINVRRCHDETDGRAAHCGDPAAPDCIKGTWCEVGVVKWETYTVEIAEMQRNAIWDTTEAGIAESAAATDAKLSEERGSLDNAMSNIKQMSADIIADAEAEKSENVAAHIMAKTAAAAHEVEALKEKLVQNTEQLEETMDRADELKILIAHHSVTVKDAAEAKDRFE
jgi:uncharacterized membrane protein